MSSSSGSSCRGINRPTFSSRSIAQAATNQVASSRSHDSTSSAERWRNASVTLAIGTSQTSTFWSRMRSVSARNGPRKTGSSTVKLDVRSGSALMGSPSETLLRQARMIPPAPVGTVEARSDQQAVTPAEERAQPRGDRAHDAQDRRAEEEEHHEHEQRQVLVRVDVDLLRPSLEEAGDDPRAVESGDRDQVEDEQHDVHEQEPEDEPRELPAGNDAEDEPGGDRQSEVRERAGQRDEGFVALPVPEVGRLVRHRLAVGERDEGRPDRDEQEEEGGQHHGAEAVDVRPGIERESPPSARRRISEPVGDEGVGVLVDDDARDQSDQQVQGEGDGPVGHRRVTIAHGPEPPG